MVSEDVALKVRLADDASIFTAEAIAIIITLTKYIKKSSKSNFIVFSDSLSCLLAMKTKKLVNPLISRIYTELDNIYSSGKNVVFCWVRW